MKALEETEAKIQDRSSAHAEFQSTKARESFDEGILSSDVKGFTLASAGE